MYSKIVSIVTASRFSSCCCYVPRRECPSQPLLRLQEPPHALIGDLAPATTARFLPLAVQALLHEDIHHLLHLPLVEDDPVVPHRLAQHQAQVFAVQPALTGAVAVAAVEQGEQEEHLGLVALAQEVAKDQGEVVCA